MNSQSLVIIAPKLRLTPKVSSLYSLQHDIHADLQRSFNLELAPSQCLPAGRIACSGEVNRSNELNGRILTCASLLLAL